MDVSQSTSDMNWLLAPEKKEEDSRVSVVPFHLKTSDFLGDSEVSPTTRQKVPEAHETAFNVRVSVGKATWLIADPFHNMRYGVSTRELVDESKELTPPVTRHEVVVPQAMSVDRKPVGQPDVETNDQEPPSHFVRKVTTGSIMLLVCWPYPTDIQNEVDTHETSSTLFEYAAGLGGVSVVTVSNSAEAEPLETARSPVPSAATSSTDDKRRRTDEMDLESGRDMTHLSKRIFIK
jgi:hypothetical protein